MLRRISLVFLMLFSIVAEAVTPVNNQIAMSYATMSVTQMTVASAAMRAGGTFSLSVQAVDGGGRGPPNFPNDIANLTITFYNYSNGVIGTAVSNNTTVFNTWNTYTVNSTNCGGASCSQLAYLVVSFTGNDGGYWAGNAGTNFKDPKLTFTPTGQATSTTNILYNPEFGVYGTYATNSGPNGWSNSTGTWGGNTHPQLLNLSGTLNAAGGGYFSAANTGSGRAGGYPQSTGPTVTNTGSGYITTTATTNGVVYTYKQPVTITYWSDGTTTTANNGAATLLSTTQTGASTGISTAQTATKNTVITKRNNVNGNGIYVDQAGSNNTFDITQGNGNNSIQGKNQQQAILNGDSNTVTVKQGNPYDTAGKNLIQLEMNTGSNSNQIKLYQGYNADGTPNYSDGDGHIISLGLTGSSNQITVYQTNTSLTAGHYADLNINGNTNNISVTQKGNGSKTLFSTVSGNNNTVTAAQDGLGQDYLNINLTGNGHNVTANQDGIGNHLGYIDLTNSGGASTVNLNQTGSVSQSYSIIQNCLNPAGCSVSVTQ